MNALKSRWIGRRILLRHYGTSTARPPLISINNGTFYRHHPNSLRGGTQTNPPLFENLSLEIDSFSSTPKYWSIIGPSSSGKTTFLQILRGRHLCIPPRARSFPYLESEDVEKKGHRLRDAEKAMQYVGFDGEQGLGSRAPQSAYLSARYESRREATDFSVKDYLLGNTELNPFEDVDGKYVDPKALQRVIQDLRLGGLVDMPVSNLSNGQTRRARIAKALLGSPELLLLDEPFMGLDPPTLLRLSPMLEGLAKDNTPRLVMSLRPQDPIPDWITHLIYLKGDCEIAFQGLKEEVLDNLKEYAEEIKQGRIKPDIDIPVHSLHEIGRKLTKSGIIQSIQPVKSQIPQSLKPRKETQSETMESSLLSRDGYEFHDGHHRQLGDALVEIEGALVAYGPKAVLGTWKQDVNGTKKDGLWWTIRRGERWGIFGPNGSGKTTILSLICSDHPQAYSLPIKLFGRSRTPEPGQLGVSIFDIQARIGHSSPEIHNHIPKSLSLRRVLESAWAETFRGRPELDATANERVDSCLRWFEQDLRLGESQRFNVEGGVGEDALEQETSNAVLDAYALEKPAWADGILFGRLPFSAQRVALFLRAIIKQPDIIILDEAFSGMDDGVRDRCLLFLAHGETKSFSSAKEDYQKNEKQGQSIVESRISHAKQVKLHGLSNHQALLCISHVREEIPGSIREWICLPEANTGEPARFGRLKGPIEGDYRRWDEIWGM